MAITKRKDIINDLLYRMGLIRKIQGYDTDIYTVARHRDTAEEPFNLDEVPALNVVDGKGAITHLVSDDEHALDVRLSVVTSSRVSASEVDDIIGDVLKCIEANSTWGGHADGTRAESHTIDLSQGGDTITSGIIDIVIDYTTEKGKA